MVVQSLSFFFQVQNSKPVEKKVSFSSTSIFPTLPATTTTSSSSTATPPASPAVDATSYSPAHSSAYAGSKPSSSLTEDASWKSQDSETFERATSANPFTTSTPTPAEKLSTAANATTTHSSTTAKPSTTSTATAASSKSGTKREIKIPSLKFATESRTPTMFMMETGVLRVHHVPGSDPVRGKLVLNTPEKCLVTITMQVTAEYSASLAQSPVADITHSRWTIQLPFIIHYLPTYPPIKWVSSTIFVPANVFIVKVY